MTEFEYTSLEELLELLDDLFDDKVQFPWVHKALVRTHAALSDSDHAPALTAAIERTEPLLRQSLSRESMRDRALYETDELRLYLAGVLDE